MPDIPDYLRIPQAVRNQWWIDHPPRAARFVAPKAESPDMEFKQRLEAAANAEAKRLTEGTS